MQTHVCQDPSTPKLVPGNTVRVPTADGQVMFFVTMEQDGLQGLFQSLATSPLRSSDCPTNYEDVDTDVVGTSRDWANRLQTTGLHTKYMQFPC